VSPDDLAEGVPEAIPEAELAAFAAMKSDPTGIVTFDRFLWQAKMAVRTWLTLLVKGETLAVVCEHVEDLAIVGRSEFCFAQLKTRDRGSWSAAKVCEDGHAVQRLVESYVEAEKAGIASRSRFEAWLEGPPSTDSDTRTFFDDPSAAPESVKKKIRVFGITGKRLADFLGRLAIRYQQPARQSVDDMNIRLMGVIWPGLTVGQLETLYGSLLEMAQAAQSASEPPARLRELLRAGQEVDGRASIWEPIARQALTEASLRRLCPPVPTDTLEDLVARAANGEASLLELKLVRAGASSATVQAALLARADSDISATESRVAGSMTEGEADALEQRLLSMATSITALAQVSGSALARPAEFIFHNLMANPANTSGLDVDGIYGKDHRLVVGHLCGVSDKCRYAWGLS